MKGWCILWWFPHWVRQLLGCHANHLSELLLYWYRGSWCGWLGWQVLWGVVWVWSCCVNWWAFHRWLLTDSSWHHCARERKGWLMGSWTGPVPGFSHRPLVDTYHIQMLITYHNWERPGPFITWMKSMSSQVDGSRERGRHWLKGLSSNIWYVFGLLTFQTLSTWTNATRGDLELIDRRWYHFVW